MYKSSVNALLFTVLSFSVVSPVWAMGRSFKGCIGGEIVDQVVAEPGESCRSPQCDEQESDQIHAEQIEDEIYRLSELVLIALEEESSMEWERLRAPSATQDEDSLGHNESRSVEAYCRSRRSNSLGGGACLPGSLNGRILRELCVDQNQSPLGLKRALLIRLCRIEFDRKREGRVRRYSDLGLFQMHEYGE